MIFFSSFMQNYIKFNELEKKDKNKNPPAIRNLFIVVNSISNKCGKMRGVACSVICKDFTDIFLY